MDEDNVHGKQERLKQFYGKVRSHYAEGRFPESRPYLVYADRFYSLIYKLGDPSPESELRYSAFMNVLEDWIRGDKELDLQKFKQEVQAKIKSGRPKEYTIFFGVPVKQGLGADFPFKKSLTVKNVQFQKVSYRTVSRLSNGTYLDAVVNSYEKRGFNRGSALIAIESSYAFFKAKVTEHRENTAVNKVSSAFEAFSAAVTIAQERFTTVETWGGSIKSRKAILNPYTFFVDKASANPHYENLYQVQDSQFKLPEQTLNLTKDKKKYARYKKYLAILSKEKPTPIEQRISAFLLEFDRAFETEHAHLRALGLWRCLEVATRPAGGATMKEKEIIAIISKFYTGEVWKIQGEIILESRNLFVHEGQSFLSQNRDHHLGWLQEYASATLSLLMWMYENNIGKKSVSEIEDFFSYYPDSNESLHIAQKIRLARQKMVKAS